jgi:hypothetical protein
MDVTARSGDCQYQPQTKLARKAGTIPATELALIKTVKGFAAKEITRVDEKRTVTRTGDKAISAK